jgi:hypothetical protein
MSSINHPYRVSQLTKDHQIIFSLDSHGKGRAPFMLSDEFGRNILAKITGIRTNENDDPFIKNRLEILKKALNSGARRLVGALDDSIIGRTQSGTLLHRVRELHPAVLSVLLEAGFCPYGGLSQSKETPLDLAKIYLTATASDNAQEVVQQLTAATTAPKKDVVKKFYSKVVGQLWGDVTTMLSNYPWLVNDADAKLLASLLAITAPKPDMDAYKKVLTIALDRASYHTLTQKSGNSNLVKFAMAHKDAYTNDDKDPLRIAMVAALSDVTLVENIVANSSTKTPLKPGDDFDAAVRAPNAHTLDCLAKVAAPNVQPPSPQSTAHQAAAQAIAHAAGQHNSGGFSNRRRP